MFKVLLSKADDSTSLRTDVVEGWCRSWPEKGKEWSMNAPALEGSGVRMVRTSCVERITRQEKDIIEFITVSGSHYRIIKGEELVDEKVFVTDELQFLVEILSGDTNDSTNQ